ncbi:MAG: methyl-accepting chemotaxis sensory transducer with Cache sensor [Firmicutes bacterium]|nr:methyl-accepting chemotaxis sensory transducer with Cache sensor [Bacillota bacterium]
MKIKSIQTRLLVFLLPLILIVSSALAGAGYYLSAQYLSKSVEETARAVGMDYANRIQGDIEVMMTQLEDLASIQRVRSGADKAQIVTALAEAHQRIAKFDAIVFVSPDGAGVNNAGGTAAYGDRDYFKKVIATKKSVVSDPLISKSTGKLSVVLAVPVADNGRLTGVLVGTFSLERIDKMVSTIKFLDTGYGHLSDDSGNVVAHPKHPEYVNKLNLNEKKVNPELGAKVTELDDNLINLFKTAAQEGKQTRHVYKGLDGVQSVAVSTPIDLSNNRWVMMVEAPEAEATKVLGSLAQAMLIISIICLLLAGGAIVFIAKLFAKPISLLRDECQLLAQGDLRDKGNQITSEDEIGQLQAGFQEMRRNLRELTSKMLSQSEQVAASSEELTASAEQSAQAANQVAISITEVAQGTAQQIHAVEQTMSVVEQISAAIQQTAATSNEVASMAMDTTQAVKGGQQAVNKAVQQMDNVGKGSAELQVTVEKLADSSKKIGQIVSVISGIAGQTNLLALNAAIEAARAGEAGRGFAVVAEEVRKLAEQSATAATEITTLVTDNTNSIDNAVAVMNSSTENIKVGIEVVNGAGQAFDAIAQQIHTMAEQVKEISAATQEVAVGSQRIVEAIKNIEETSKDAAAQAQTVSAATEEQSASMEEIASSSQGMAKLATEMQMSVSAFKI